MYWSDGVMVGGSGIAGKLEEASKKYGHVQVQRVFADEREVHEMNME